MSNKDVAQMKGRIFGNLFYLANTLENLGNKIFTEITMKQWFLLVSIYSSEICNPTLSEVAKIMGYSRQNVKKIAVHLEKKGYIVFVKDQSDSRVLRISFTDKCIDYFKGREDREDAFIENLFDGLGNDEIESLLVALEKIKVNSKGL